MILRVDGQLFFDFGIGAVFVFECSVAAGVVPIKVSLNVTVEELSGVLEILYFTTFPLPSYSYSVIDLTSSFKGVVRLVTLPRLSYS